MEVKPRNGYQEKQSVFASKDNGRTPEEAEERTETDNIAQVIESDVIDDMYKTSVERMRSRRELVKEIVGQDHERPGANPPAAEGYKQYLEELRKEIRSEKEEKVRNKSFEHERSLRSQSESNMAPLDSLILPRSEANRETTRKDSLNEYGHLKYPGASFNVNIREEILHHGHLNGTSDKNKNRESEKPFEGVSDPRKPKEEQQGHKNLWEDERRDNRFGC
jgi:hypothetical protein